MLTPHADEMLKKYSRTFYNPICQLPGDLGRAVASGYLAMRAIDEIEDSETLKSTTKIELLNSLHHIMRVPDAETRQRVDNCLTSYKDKLLDVVLSLPEWLELAPDNTFPVVLECVSNMANRMAFWVESEWTIRNQDDLDAYTFDVAGTIGIFLSTLISYYCNCAPNIANGVRFGRGLQLTNIVLNRQSDLERGVDFFPDGWDDQRMIDYARSHFPPSHEFISELNNDAARDFCTAPLELAEMSLAVYVDHGHGLQREQVQKYFATTIGG